MKNSKVFTFTAYIFLSIITVILVFPFFNMISLSFMDYNEITTIPQPWFPNKLYFENFQGIFSAFGVRESGASWVWTFLKNTLTIMVFQISGMILSCCFCAYGFAKIKFPGRNIIFFGVLSTMMLPGSVTMISSFVMYKNFGWLDTLLPFTVPSWFGGGAMNIFLMRQFMRTIPNTLLESATIDGAGHLRCFWSIIMPNVKPMIFKLFLDGINGVWGDFFGPMLYINAKEKWTIGLAVKSMVSSSDVSGGMGTGAINIQMATCAVMSLVPLIIFAVGQKNYVENVTLTGIKG